ncbi:hypothetical protein PINS_up010805 [Pythium insidiosum]|nr:hypothetical protein PINS_up010805 [Pythium insidiosum]
MAAMPPSSRLQIARERLVAANVLMRYDYAWCVWARLCLYLCVCVFASSSDENGPCDNRKETEFQRCEHRTTGVVCRLLYLLHVYQHAVRDAQSRVQEVDSNGDAVDGSDAPLSVAIQANGYDEFAMRITDACQLMDVPVLDDPHEATLVFVYVPPHGETRAGTDDPYATFEATTTHHHERSTPADRRPVFCFLLGEASFLEPPATGEVERLRGLSGFAISQQLTPRLQSAQYTSIAHFAVEFTPSTAKSTTDRSQLGEIMSQFGCMDHNMMHQNEKWELYASQDSALGASDGDVTQPSEDEARFWLELARGKTCDHCHAMHEKLSRCSRCSQALYCSRNCQRAAWKLHKQLCGQPSG